MTARTIAIDGPAGSGKGTAARGLAQRLGHAWVDTGAIYRSVALVAQEQAVSWDDGPALAAVARTLPIRFEATGSGVRVLLGDREVTTAIRTSEMGTGASRVSRHPAVRDALLDLQRQLASSGPVVMDGRDIGTVVLPDADLKVYLDASVDERARRRLEEMASRGEPGDPDTVRARIEARDRQDRERAVAPLRAADDAVRLDTTALGPDAVVDRLVALAEAVDPASSAR